MPELTNPIFYFTHWIHIWVGVVVGKLHLILHTHICNTELAELILPKQSDLWLLTNVLQHRL